MTRVSRPNSTLKVNTERPLRREKGLTRRAGLKAFSSLPRRQLSRSAPRKVAGYDYAGFVQAIAERTGVDCWVRRNVPMDPALLACDGVLDGHHCLSKEWIKDFARSRERALWFDDPEPFDLAATLNDARNGILLCRRHHDLLENARITLPRDQLPDHVEEFASEFGARAVARLGRVYGERTA